MVVKNAVANKETVRIAVDAGQLRGESLGATVRARRQERSCFSLRRFRRISENLGARGVVNFHWLGLVARDLKQPQCRHSDFIASRFRNFEAQTHVALPGEIDFRGLHFRKDAPQGGSIGKIAVMQEETLVVHAFIAPQMFDARAQEIARSPNNSMNGVPFSEKQFRQVRPILAGDAGDKRSLWISIHQRGFRLAPINEGYGSHKGEPPD